MLTLAGMGSDLVAELVEFKIICPSGVSRVGVSVTYLPDYVTSSSGGASRVGNSVTYLPDYVTIWSGGASRVGISVT